MSAQETQWQRLKALGVRARAHPAGTWFMLFVGLVGTIILWLFPDTSHPGIPIGLLGVVAAVIAVLSPTPFQKGLVIILAVGLYLLEIKSIDKEHDSQEKVHYNDQMRLGIGFALTAAQGAKSFSDTEQGFADIHALTVQELTASAGLNANTADNLRLTVKALNTLNGGDAFPLLLPYGSPGSWEGGNVTLEYRRRAAHWR